MSTPSMQQHNASNSTLWNTSSSLAPSIVLGMCCLLGIPGNVLVAVAILRNVRHTTLTVKLMLNLALTDLLSLVLALFWIPALLGDWPYDAPLCKLLSYALYCSLYCGVLTVTLMGVQRCLTVVFLKRVRLHGCGAGGKALLTSLWASAFALALPACTLRTLMRDGGRLRCQPLYGSQEQQVAVLLLETLLGFVVPGVLLSTSYLCIARRAARLPLASKRRLSRLVTWVVACFIAFWCPTHVANLLHVSAALAPQQQAGMLRRAGEQIRNVSGALTFLNCCTNPFLYAFASRSLRTSSSVMKRLERVFHSKVLDTPPRKASLCPPGANFMLPSYSQSLDGPHHPAPVDRFLKREGMGHQGSCTGLPGQKQRRN